MVRSLLCSVGVLAAVAFFATEGVSAPRRSLAPGRVSLAAARTVKLPRSTRGMKKGTMVYVLQVRNPAMAASALTTPLNAELVRTSLHYQGYSAHVHDLGSQGSFVHYGMMHWTTKGIVTNRLTADQAAVVFRSLGLEARVLVRKV